MRRDFVHFGEVGGTKAPRSSDDLIAFVVGSDGKRLPVPDHLEPGDPCPSGYEVTFALPVTQENGWVFEWLSPGLPDI
jgi:hypothetical protein